MRGTGAAAGGRADRCAARRAAWLAACWLGWAGAAFAAGAEWRVDARIESARDFTRIAIRAAPRREYCPPGTGQVLRASLHADSSVSALRAGPIEGCSLGFAGVSRSRAVVVGVLVLEGRGPRDGRQYLKLLQRLGDREAHAELRYPLGLDFELVPTQDLTRLDPRARIGVCAYAGSAPLAEVTIRASAPGARTRRGRTGADGCAHFTPGAGRPLRFEATRDVVAQRQTAVLLVFAAPAAGDASR